MSWLESHAISPALAASCGVTGERGGEIRFRYGHTYERVRGTDGITRQPKGQPLSLYWPTGRTQAHTVLLCEGEGDTLAAASVLCDSEGEPRTFGDVGLDNLLAGVCPVGVPGTSTPVRVIGGELLAAGTKLAYVVMDPDEAGIQACDRYCAILRAVGISATPLELEHGDLSETLVAAEDRPSALASLIAEAEDRMGVAA